jgi:hypothetical protein
VRAALPNESDGLYVVQRERSRILKRTAAGVDAQGRQFTAYSKRYAKQKAKFRDPSTVDLRGRNAPHMLQAMVVTSGSLKENGESAAPVQTLAIGFYDERAALLARVHNEGTRRMPRRNFFSAENDIGAMERDLSERVQARQRAMNT